MYIKFTKYAVVELQCSLITLTKLTSLMATVVEFILWLILIIKCTADWCGLLSTYVSVILTDIFIKNVTVMNRASCFMQDMNSYASRGLNVNGPRGGNYHCSEKHTFLVASHIYRPVHGAFLIVKELNQELCQLNRIWACFLYVRLGEWLVRISVSWHCFSLQ